MSQVAQLDTPIRFRDYERLAHQVARKGYSWVMAAGCRGFDYDDVFQEVSLSFAMALAKFDPTRGFKFSTYFVKSAWFNLKALVQANAPADQVTTMSMDQPIGEDGDSTLGSVIEDEKQMSALDGLMRLQTAERTLARLSEHARAAVLLVINTPPDFAAEMKALHARAAFGREIGHGGTAEREFSIRVALNFLGYSTRMKEAVYAEIEAMLAEVSQK